MLQNQSQVFTWLLISVGASPVGFVRKTFTKTVELFYSYPTYKLLSWVFWQNFWCSKYVSPRLDFIFGLRLHKERGKRLSTEFSALSYHYTPTILNLFQIFIRKENAFLDIAKFWFRFASRVCTPCFWILINSHSELTFSCGKWPCLGHRSELFICLALCPWDAVPALNRWWTSFLQDSHWIDFP